MSVCALEYHSLGEILGPSAAAAELREHAGYSWIYGQILANPGWFSSFLHRHGLQVPAQPPVPAAASAKRGGQALTERRPGPRPPSPAGKAAHPEPSHGGTVTTDQHQLRSGQSTVTSGKQTRSGLANETKTTPRCHHRT
jgi:hypothetical protein